MSDALIIVLVVLSIVLLFLIVRRIPGALVIENGKVRISLWLFLVIVGAATFAVVVWVGWFALLVVLAIIVNWLIRRSAIFW